jgi:hypothetical protein
LTEENLYYQPTKMQIYQPYGPGWRLMQISTMDHPKNLAEWRRFLWGYDIFCGSVPFLKSLVAANVIVWLLMLAFHP